MAWGLRQAPPPCGRSRRRGRGAAGWMRCAGGGVPETGDGVRDWHSRSGSLAVFMTWERAIPEPGVGACQNRRPGGPAGCDVWAIGWTPAAGARLARRRLATQRDGTVTGSRRCRCVACSVATSLSCSGMSLNCDPRCRPKVEAGRLAPHPARRVDSVGMPAPTRRRGGVEVVRSAARSAPCRRAHHGVRPASALDAVTVDDLPVHGPLISGVNRVLIAERFIEAFRRHGLPPVYGFVNGLRVDEHPESEEVLSLWVRAGNRVGNHTPFSRRGVAGRHSAIRFSSRATTPRSAKGFADTSSPATTRRPR
jgi:hypothetical protein